MSQTTSIATENFIKALYKYESGSDMSTRPGYIAKELGISSAAATDMARKLARKKLIEYEKYRELKLSPNGKKLALNIIRRHRLWETFLHRIFDLSMHEIHREAEILEHYTSEFLMEKISDYLDNPEFDPHGDPIPSAKGVLSSDSDSIVLTMAQPGEEYVISRLYGSDKEFFDFCYENDLSVGSVVVVKKQYSKTKMTEIAIKKIRLLLNAELAGTIYVKK